jgi:hypothetical protein
MPLFNRQINWRGLGATAVIELLVLLAIAFSVVRYIEWSSEAALAEFMIATTPSVSDPQHSGEIATGSQALKERASLP